MLPNSFPYFLNWSDEKYALYLPDQDDSCVFTDYGHPMRAFFQNLSLVRDFGLLSHFSAKSKDCHTFLQDFLFGIGL